MVVKLVLWVVLFALLVGKTNTAPLTAKAEDKTKTTSVNKYKLHIQTNHVMLEEDMIIDTKRETETFVIPKHKLEVIKDFSKRLDIIFDNKTNICYLSRQQPFEARPGTLKHLMENKSIYKHNNVVLRKTTKWKADTVFTGRFLLSKEMAMMCARSPIYWIHKIEGTGSESQSRDSGLPKEVRVCSNGFSYATSPDADVNPVDLQEMVLLDEGQAVCLGPIIDLISAKTQE